MSVLKHPNSAELPLSPSRLLVAQENSIPFDDENSLDSRFECPICLQCLKDAVLTSCGHRFCNNCLQMWIRREGGCCPVDYHNLRIETDIFPDNFTRREIHNLYHKQSPENSINNEVVECLFRAVGCSTTLPNSAMQMHLKTEVQYHLNLLNAAYVTKMDIDRNLARSQEANTMWDPDTKGDAHQEGENFQPLIRLMYQRIVTLEQRCNEQEIKMENMGRLIAAGTAVTDHISSKYCCGSYIWKLENFSEKLVAMRQNPLITKYFSSGFYTSPTGYRFCARVNLSSTDVKCIGIYIHLMKGENDCALNWPFTGKIAITMVNHDNSALNSHDTMMSDPKLDAFKKPDTEICTRGFGYTEFASLEDLSKGFISKSDTVIFKIDIRCV